jgi:hypothetical protein
MSTSPSAVSRTSLQISPSFQTSMYTFPLYTYLSQGSASPPSEHSPSATSTGSFASTGVDAKPKRRMIVRSFISISKTTIVTFWEGVGLLVFGVAKRVHDMTLVGTELVVPRFHVPRVVVLLFAKRTGIEIYHLNLHYPCMMQMLRVTADRQVESKALRAAEVCHPKHHWPVLVLATFPTHDLCVVTTLYLVIKTLTTVGTVFHYCLRCLSLIIATRIASSMSVLSSCFLTSLRTSIITFLARSYS